MLLEGEILCGVERESEHLLHGPKIATHPLLFAARQLPLPTLRPSLQGSQEPYRRAHRSPSPHHRVHLQPVVEASRECPEAVPRCVMSLYSGVEVVRIILRPRLLGLLRAEPRARRQDSVEHTRGEALVEDQRLSCSTRDEITRRVLSCVQDYIRHGLWLVDRWDAHRFDAELGASLIEERGVYGPRHHLGHADGPFLVLEFYSQGLKKPVYAVLGGSVGAVEREGALGFDRGDVYQ